MIGEIVVGILIAWAIRDILNNHDPFDLLWEVVRFMAVGIVFLAVLGSPFIIFYGIWWLTVNGGEMGKLMAGFLILLLIAAIVIYGVVEGIKEWREAQNNRLTRIQYENDWFGRLEREQEARYIERYNLK